MFGSSLPLVVCRRAYVLFTVCYLCLCGYSDVKYVLTMRVTWWCLIRGRNCLPFARTLVHPRFVVASVLFIFLVFSAVLFGLFVLFLCLVYPMLPVSLDCSFLIASSGFSNVYLAVLIRSFGVFVSKNLTNLVFQSFDFERIWWRLLQKRIWWRLLQKRIWWRLL
jgi:hypothetical protein